MKDRKLESTAETSEAYGMSFFRMEFLIFISEVSKKSKELFAKLVAENLSGQMHQSTFNVKWK